MREPVADLGDLVAVGLKRLRSEAQVTGVEQVRMFALRFHHDGGGLENSEAPDQRFEFGLACRGEHIVGIDVDEIGPGIVHVVGAENHHLRCGRCHFGNVSVFRQGGAGDGQGQQGEGGESGFHLIHSGVRD